MPSIPSSLNRTLHPKKKGVEADLSMAEDAIRPEPQMQYLPPQEEQNEAPLKADYDIDRED
jgi:hypothetical protein